MTFFANDSHPLLNCQNTIDGLNLEINKYESIINDPNNYVYEYFAPIKIQVNLQREILKEKIDACYERILENIEQTEADCRSLAKNIDVLSEELNKIKQETKILSERFTNINGDDNLDTFKTELLDLKSKLSKTNKKLFDKVLMGHRFNFIPGDIDFQDLFGQFEITTNSFEDSKILDKQKVNDLIKLCDFDYNLNWKLIYRGSDHGFASERFHEKCDGVAKSLTIIKCSNDFIFGGYTDAKWSSESEFVEDTNAFLFSLVNCMKKPRKIKCSKPKYAIYSHKQFGPCFGSSELTINSHSNLISSKSHNLADDRIYVELDYPYLFSGNNGRFKTVEIEIYTIEQ